MKHKISTAAVAVLTRICGAHAASPRAVLTIGDNYTFFVRSRAAFRGAAGDIIGGVPLEVYPGLSKCGAVGIDAQGKAWIAYQDESTDILMPVARAKLDDGDKCIASHVVALIECKLLALTYRQIARLSRAFSELDATGAIPGAP